MSMNKWACRTMPVCLGLPSSDTLTPATLYMIEDYLGSRGWFHARNHFLVMLGCTTVPHTDPCFRKYRVKSGRRPFDALVAFDHAADEYTPSILVVDTHEGLYKIMVTNTTIWVERKQKRGR